MIASCANLNVLFVDDDPLILQGLQRMLRSMRSEWSMSFVESGAKALEMMAEAPFNVVVSDMRMPGMNGAQLLTETKNRYPRTVRLILSGHADKDLILQCVGTAHQFLSKPCEPDAIRAAITRASVFNSSVKSEQIQKLIVQMDKIPSIPSVYTEIVEKLKDDETSIEEIGSLVAKDLAITAKLLKLVNSSFFGLSRQIASPAEAAAYLGIDTLKALVLGVNAFGGFERLKVSVLSLENLLSHSLRVGDVARRIMECESAPRAFAEESFLAGMLHDIGKLVLAHNMPHEYERALARSREEKVPVFQAEEQVFGINHADVAGCILSLWGLPMRVVEAITDHHEPKVFANGSITPVIAVHVANCAVHSYDASPNNKIPLNMRFDLLSPLGFHEKLPTWMNLAVC